MLKVRARSHWAINAARRLVLTRETAIGAACLRRSLRVEGPELLVAVEAQAPPRLRIATALDADGMSIA
jgi:hypothetical protein